MWCRSFKNGLMSGNVFLKFLSVVPSIIFSTVEVIPREAVSTCPLEKFNGTFWNKFTIYEP